MKLPILNFKFQFNLKPSTSENAIFASRTQMRKNRNTHLLEREREGWTIYQRSRVKFVAKREEPETLTFLSLSHALFVERKKS